jgi:hypothetical protein
MIKFSLKSFHLKNNTNSNGNEEKENKRHTYAPDTEAWSRAIPTGILYHRLRPYEFRRLQ